MRIIDFNKDWHYRHLDSDEEWIPVSIPHDAMLREKRSADSPGGVHAAWFEGHDYEYMKKFHVPAEYRDKKVIFEFEGVYQRAEVYINGRKAAYRPYGYTNFFVDVDGFLKYGGENTIRVIARNKEQPNSRWYSGAGIYRPVNMYLADRDGYIKHNGVKIRTLSINPAIIEIKVITEGSGEVEIEIFDGMRSVQKQKGKTGGELAMQMEIPEARLWGPGQGNLYTCKVRFGTDEAEVNFGIRTISYGKEGFFINGERVILRGACIHHDNGLLGACAYPEAEERKIRILMENGYNAVRSAHNPCSKALLEACDRMGMLVLDEYVDMWYIHKTHYDYADYLMDWWKEDLRDMVDKDYNHPSVIMYSIGNEVSETAQKKGIQLTKEMTEYLHSLDYRPVTCGVNIFFNFLSSIGFGVYNDIKAEKEARSVKKKKVGSEFYNHLAGLLGADFMKTGAQLYFCDLKTRDAFANMDIAGYNYGIKRYRHDLKKYPDRLILGTETFCSDAYKFWEMARENPRLIGDFVWAGMDYLGEVGVGSWEYKDYAPDFSHGAGWISAGSGRIDLTGKPLAEAAYTRVAFELEKGPIIAVRPVKYTGEKHSPSAWKMTNAIESWSWRGYEGEKAVVEVYARAASVALYINGKKVGKKPYRNDCKVIFKTRYENGEIMAVAYDERGKEIARSVLYTAGLETELRAVPEQPTVQAGKLAYIRLQYTDKNGVIKPLERNLLHVELTGGELLALGNGCPYNEIGYLTNITDTYYGEALAIVKARDAGEIMLKVTDGDRHGMARVRIVQEENDI